jgi:hypothetical protein
MRRAYVTRRGASAGFKIRPAPKHPLDLAGEHCAEVFFDARTLRLTGSVKDAPLVEQLAELREPLAVLSVWLRGGFLD